MPSGCFYGRNGISLTSSLNSPPLTPVGGGHRPASLPDPLSPLTSNDTGMAVIGAKLDSLLAAVSEHSRLLSGSRADCKNTDLFVYIFSYNDSLNTS